MLRTVAQVQAATQYRQKRNYYFLKHLLTVKHEKTCSFCQKPKCLHLINNSAIVHLRGIKLIQ